MGEIAGHLREKGVTSPISILPRQLAVPSKVKRRGITTTEGNPNSIQRIGSPIQRRRNANWNRFRTKKFLGFEIDSKLLLTKVPMKKIRDLRTKINGVVKAKAITVRNLTSLIGLLIGNITDMNESEPAAAREERSPQEDGLGPDNYIREGHPIESPNRCIRNRMGSLHGRKENAWLLDERGGKEIKQLAGTLQHIT